MGASWRKVTIWFLAQSFFSLSLFPSRPAILSPDVKSTSLSATHYHWHRGLHAPAFCVSHYQRHRKKIFTSLLRAHSSTKPPSERCGRHSSLSSSRAARWSQQLPLPFYFSPVSLQTSRGLLGCWGPYRCCPYRWMRRRDVHGSSFLNVRWCVRCSWAPDGPMSPLTPNWEIASRLWFLD